MKVKREIGKRLHSFKEVIWNKMGFCAVFNALVDFIHSIIRLLVYPVKRLNHYTEYINEYADKNSKKPTEKHIKSRMISTIIDGIFANKDSALGNSSVVKLKYLAIFLLEIVSFITTTIGLTIVAGDISPAIAIIWALVIQGLAGTLSASRGRRNAIILTICLLVSITSDYVCYINAVFPYDKYLEEQYVTYKSSYDIALEKAISLLREFESSDEIVEGAFYNTERVLSSLETMYSSDNISIVKEDIAQLKQRLKSTDATITKRVSQSTITDTDTSQIEKSEEYVVVENPEYKQLVVEISALEEKLEKMSRIYNTAVQIRKDFSNINNLANGNAEEMLKQLMKQANDINNSDETVLDNTGNNQENLQVLSGRLSEIQKIINQLIVNEGLQITPIEEYDFSKISLDNDTFRILSNLKLPEFSTVRSELESETSSFFDAAISGFSKIVDSDFVTNTVDLRNYIRDLTTEYHEQFLSATTSLNDDQELYNLLYGNQDITEDTSEILCLQKCYKAVTYQDALSRALSFLIDPKGKAVEIYSRVAYALLADGLVLLIGWTLKRRKTSIYRIHSYRDLTNEEPRLISEAFYNLAAQPIDGKDAYSVENLIAHIEKFLSYFMVQPYVRDKNLDKNYSMVCDSTKIDILNNEYKELVNLLFTLRCIKPISKNKYDYFVNYKMSKFIGESDKNFCADIPFENSDKYCYLMTEGCSLYLSEKLNDLYQHKENDKSSKTIKDDIEVLKKGG